MKAVDLARKVLIALIEDDLGLVPPEPAGVVAEGSERAARRDLVRARVERMNQERQRAQRGL